jgi:hypothetical protein
MKREDLKKLIEGKRRWTETHTLEDMAKGFKGWYSSKYLPHFDSPGAQQYITYRLADSLPVERKSEWAAILGRLRMTWKSSAISNAISTWAMGLVTCATGASPRWCKKTYGTTTATGIVSSHG